jgi:hypothetical protein
MRKWLVVPIVVALSPVVVPTLATAAGNPKCSLNLTVLTAPVKDTGSPPLSGTELRGGTVDGKLCGKQFVGAQRVVITFAGAGKRTVDTTVFGPRGSFKTNGPVVAVPQPNGSLSITGRGKITAGTGLYRGATGSFSATGTKPANSNVNTIHITGTIKF